MSVQTLFQIEIPKRQPSCSLCTMSLIPGMEIYCLLQKRQGDERYLRHDYCLACWEKIETRNVKGGHSTWKSKILLKNESSELPKQRDAHAMYLLKDALIRSEIEDQEQAFVLALYLARKRLIYFRQEIELENGNAALLYEVKDTEEILCVRKIPLTSLQIEKIQTELVIKFNNRPLE